MVHRASFLLLLANALAQGTAPGDARLPRLLQLGPLPASAASLTLRADGSILARDGRTLAIGSLDAGISRDTKDLVLRADLMTEAAVVVAVLGALQVRGVTTVHFAATLPNGTAGAFALALPLGDATTTIGLRLHDERPGVPPTSVVPLLQRMQEGCAVGKTPFVLGVDVPGVATCEQLLQVLGAVAAAGVQRVVVTSKSAAVEPHSANAAKTGLGALAGASPAKLQELLAMDLGPIPQVRVQGIAVPLPQPAVQPKPFGCLERAGRGERAAEQPQAEEARAHPQWFALQGDDGSFATDQGRADMEATALMLLALLNDGQTLDAGQPCELMRRGIGWLLSQQQLDGYLHAGPGGITQHALATYALAEAAGRSANGALLRGSVRAALDWLFRQRQNDGGWNDGTRGAPSDALSTACCLAAIASAAFFEFPVQSAPSKLVAWFDSVAEPTGVHRLTVSTPKDASSQALATGAALFSRLCAGQDPEQAPMLAAADHLLANAALDDPRGAFWTTWALWQMGGRHWDGWIKKLSKATPANAPISLIFRTQVKDGDFKGTWEPAGGCSRMTTTALRILTLQSYYRSARLVR